jgi:hypothetical protein
LRWSTLLRLHLQGIIAYDFFLAVTASFRLLYVFVVIEHGVKASTINGALAVTRHILKLAGEEWMDDQGITWLERVPKVKLLSVRDARKAYPLSREEQAMFFPELPDHLATMALFKVNTGYRE